MDETKCPVCHSTNLSTEHLMQEYLDMNPARCNRMFGHNAAIAQDAVAEILLARGVTHIPNMFGDIAIRTGA